MILKRDGTNGLVHSHTLYLNHFLKILLPSQQFASSLFTSLHGFAIVNFQKRFEDANGAHRSGKICGTRGGRHCGQQGGAENRRHKHPAVSSLTVSEPYSNITSRVSITLVDEMIPVSRVLTAFKYSIRYQDVCACECRMLLQLSTTIEVATFHETEIQEGCLQYCGTLIPR